MPNKSNEFFTNPHATYIVGYYLQDFAEPQQITNQETGEVTEIDLHRVLLCCVRPINSERWGATDFAGRETVDVPMSLDNAFTVFGVDEKSFNLKTELENIMYRPVYLDFSLNKKNKAVLRGIIPLDK